jgi:hypothetical protein
MDKPKDEILARLMSMMTSGNCKPYIQAINFAEEHSLADDLRIILINGSVKPFSEIQDVLVDTFFTSCSFEEEKRIREFNWSVQKLWEATYSPTPPAEMTLLEGYERLKHDPNMVNFTLMLSIVENRKWNDQDAHAVIEFLTGFMLTQPSVKSSWAIDILAAFNTRESWDSIEHDGLNSPNRHIRALCEEKLLLHAETRKVCVHMRVCMI